MSAYRSGVLDRLDMIAEYLEGREDVVDGDYGQPAPNEEMILLRELREASVAVAELIAVAGEMNRLAKGPAGGVSVADKRAIVSRMDAALTRCGVPA